MKLLIDCLKNGKETIKYCTLLEVIKYVSYSFKNIKTILTKNVSGEERGKLACNSFKIIIELSHYCAHCLNNLQNFPNSENEIRALTESLSYLLKNLISPSEAKTSEQYFAFEDYYLVLVKGILNLISLKSFIKKPTDIISGDDLMTVIKFIISSTGAKDTRKEIMVSFKLLKDYHSYFYQEKDFFLNENNYLRKYVICSDANLNEVVKFIVSFEEIFIQKMSPEEKCNSFEALIGRINNFRLSYDLKNKIFSLIDKILEALSKFEMHPEHKNRFFELTNYLLQELSFFFDSLMKILLELDGFYLKEEKKTKNAFLSKNMLETDLNDSDLKKLQLSNMSHLFEILLNNEYEKYAIPDEPKPLYEIFNITIKIIKHMSKIFNYEIPSSQNIVQLVNNQMIQNGDYRLNRENELSLYTKIHHKANYLSKLFYSYLYIYEQFLKSHKHSKDEDLMGTGFDSIFIDAYLNFPPSLCVAIFKRSMPLIFHLILLNVKVCSKDNCIMLLLIDKILKSPPNTPDQLKGLRKELFEVYFNYFTSKIYDIGNNVEEYETNYPYSNISISINITIIKQLFKYILCYFNDETTKHKISSLLINCIILSKNSEFFGNYIYIIRCLFKYIAAYHQTNEIQYDFHKDNLNLVYGIMKYMSNIKEAFPFLKEMITEIIMILPLKLKYLLDFTHLFFPSLIDSLNMTQEIIQIGLQFLEQWMNALFHKPEIVKPFLQKNILQLTTLLTSHLYKNVTISLNSLKLLSKFGGKSRNYLEDKGINFKTSPTQILVVNLKDKTSDKVLDFSVENIIDICVKIVTKKQCVNSIKKSMIIFKSCLLTFFDKEINYNYIMKIKKDIINNVIPHDELFNSRGYFKVLSTKEEQVKINNIYKKSEHFLLEKILRGLFLCYAMTDLEQDGKEFIQFVCDYFVLAMIAKDKNNKHIHVFEIDPITIFDIIYEFLFTNNPTVLRNANQSCTTIIAKKLIIMIIDTIENIFDKDYKVIQKLEIIDIMYMKFLNSCYSNDWPKKGVGLIFLEILIKRFSKEITYKYLQMILRAVFAVASSYSSIVEIKYQNDCKKVIKELVNLFIVDDPNYSKLTPEILNSDMDIENGNDSLSQTKNNFIMMYNMVKLSVLEIISNINSSSQYEIKICSFLIKKIYLNQKLQYFSKIIFLSDYLTMEDFLKMYQSYPPEITAEQAFGAYVYAGYNNEEMTDVPEKPVNKDLSLYPSLANLLQTSDSNPLAKFQLYNKIFQMTSTIDTKLSIKENNFTPLISNAMGLVFCFKYNPNNIVEYYFQSQAHFKLFLQMLNSIYEVLLIDIYIQLEVITHIKNAMYLLRFKCIFTEKLYLGQKFNLLLNLEVSPNEKVTFTDEIDSKYIPLIEKHVQEVKFLDNTEYTMNDPYIPEIFPFLSEKMKLVKEYIKLLELIFTNESISEKIKSNVYKNCANFSELKKKAVKLVINHVINREEAKILKSCRKFLCNVISKDKQLKDSFYLDEDLNKFYRSSLTPLKPTHIISFIKTADSLLILAKSCGFNREAFDLLRKKIEMFSAYEKNNNSLLTTYSFISLFVYMKYEYLETVADSLIDLLFKKEKEICSLKNYNSFTQTKYKNKIIKLIFLLREKFSLYLIQKCNEGILEQHYIEFYKKIVRDNRSYNIRECLAKNLTKMIEETIKDEKLNVPFLRYLLKLFNILAKKSPAMLKISNFMKKINFFFNKLIMEADTIIPYNIDVVKILKYISNLNMIYLKVYNSNNHFVFSLFHYFTKCKVLTEKNKVQLFAIIKMYSNKNLNKYKNIMYDFVTYFELMIRYGCFDSVLKYLIIPLTIKYFKDNNSLVPPKDNNNNRVNGLSVSNLGNNNGSIQSMNNNNNKIDKSFFIHILKNITSKIVVTKILEEKNNIEKWKLFSLIITIFSEHFQLKSENANSNNNTDDISIIFNNIKKIAKMQDFESKQNTSKIYWLLNACLLTKLFENRNNEKYIDTITNFYKNIGEEYINISNLAYELIFPFSKDGKAYTNIIKNLFQEKNSYIQLFQLFSLLLKFPKVFKNQTPTLITQTLNFVYKYTIQFSQLSFYYKKMLVQLLGLLIMYLSHEKKINPAFAESNELEKTEINISKLIFKMFKMSSFQEKSEIDNIDLLKTILTYYKELIKGSNFEMMQMEIKTEKNKIVYLNFYIYLLKLFIFYGKKDSLYKNPEHYFLIYKALSENNMNFKMVSDLGFVMRILLDEKLLNEFNTKEKIEDEKMSEYKYQMFLCVKKIIEQNFQNISKKKVKVCDLDFDSSIFSQSTLDEIGKEVIKNVKSKGNLSIDRYVNIFPFNEFKFFILFKKFIESIYKKRPVKNVEKNSDNQSNSSHNNNLTEINEINMGSKTQFFKENQEGIFKMLNLLQSYYFENFFCYTIVYLGIIRENESKIKNNVKDVYDYFSSNKNFYTNLKTFEEIKALKKEYLDCTPNDLMTSIQSSNESLLNFYYIIPDTFLSGFLYFFTCKDIMTTYGTRLNELFVNTYLLLKDKIHQPILEHLIVTILYSPFQSTKTKNKILFDILNLHDFILDKLNPSLINIACDYLDKYADDLSNPKLDKTILYSLRILIYSSHNSDIKIRKRIFKLFRKYHGNNLIDILKWLFTYVEWGGKYSENNPLWMAFSVDILLDHFKGNTPLETKDKCLSKMHKLINNEENSDMMVVDNDSQSTDPQDPRGVIKGMVEKYNKFMENKLTKHLMVPIRDIILTEPTLSQKIWYSLFPQIWKILSKEDREMLNIYINQFLLELIKKGKCFNIIKSMIESLANCYPLIKIPPEVMLSLTHNQNTWTSSFFYIENLFIANVDRERSYHCLVRILDILQEDQHSNGLKQFMSQNEFTISATANLQCGNYFKAEEILTHAFKHYREYIEKSEISFNDDLNEMNEDNYLNEFSNKVDFCIWQSSLVDCYKNTNKWPQIVSLTEETNDLNSKVEAMWHSGSNRWRELDKMVINKTQYPSQINQIYMMMKTNQNGGENNNEYQQKCMNCIKTIYQDFITFPPNFEKLDYYYFLVFQLIVEAWESTNTLKETEKNMAENKPSDFRENLAMWRDRLPHVCEGFQALKSILDPRNYLFEFLKGLTGNHYSNAEEANTIYLNINDKIWNYMMFIKYARKLKLYEVYYENVEIFNEEILNVKNVFPYVHYLKNLEELKFVRQVTHNYPKGIELANNNLEAFAKLTGQPEIVKIENEVLASYNSQKAYFLYKEGKILQANEFFKKAANLNVTDYHTYYDWAEMCEEIVTTIKGDEENETVWFENTIINYLMTIIYKLDKAKFVIPRMLTLIKKFENQDLTNKFDTYLNNISPWVWIFWLPVLFENFKQTINTNKNDFFFLILKNVANSYGQSVYYPLSIYSKNTTGMLQNKCEQIMSIILAKDKLCHIIDKIKIMVGEIEAKPERSNEEILLSTLTMLDIQSINQVNEAKKKLSVYVMFLQKSPWKDKAFISTMISELTEVIERRGVTIFMLFDKLKHFRYYLHSKLTTENNYQELSRVLTNKLYNIDFTGVEIPGLYCNKIMEPSDDNRICISKFESEYNSNYKFLTFLNKKLLIRGTNDKIFNFTLAKENYGTSSEIKLLQLQILLNSIFSRYNDTYQQKVKFNTSIKYFLTRETKIIQEETNMYFMNEVFEFCMQKNGYDPEIAYTIYEEETLQINPPNISYYIPEIKEKVFNRMCQIVPLNSLKSFIHKFIVSGDEIFIFRKQFATSYGLYSLLGFLFNSWITLNKISFNKETGSCTFHDIRCKLIEDISKSLEKKKDFQIRLSKNISFFLTPSCLYGVIPSVMHAATSAIVEKDYIFRKILFSVVFTQTRDRQNESLSLDMVDNYVEAFMKKIHFVRNTENEDQKEEHPLKNIFEIINSSMSDENLKKMPLFWDPWF